MPEADKKSKVPPKMLGFYQDLTKIQGKYRTGCHFTLKEGQATKQSGKNAGQLPLIRLYQPSFASEQLLAACREICSLVATHQPEVAADVHRISTLPPMALQSIIDAAISGDLDSSLDITAGTGLHAGILKFIVTNTIKPFLSQFAQQMGKEKWGGSWGKNICPVCGNRPNIGRLAKEDGKRHLRCSLCETEWLYKRLVCYNCGNEDHHTLSFLLVEEIPGYQIDVCEVCKQYLKIIDERAGFHADLQLIDVRTLYLDLIAWQQGYNNDLASSNWAHA